MNYTNATAGLMINWPRTSVDGNKSKKAVSLSDSCWTGCHFSMNIIFIFSFSPYKSTRLSVIETILFLGKVGSLMFIFHVFTSHFPSASTPSPLWGLTLL